MLPLVDATYPMRCFLAATVHTKTFYEATTMRPLLRPFLRLLPRQTATWSTPSNCWTAYLLALLVIVIELISSSICPTLPSEHTWSSFDGATLISGTADCSRRMAFFP